MADYGKYEAELDGELARDGLILAELDGELARDELILAEPGEEEQSLDRLRRRYRAIRARDLFGAPSARSAGRRLTECAGGPGRAGQAREPGGPQ